MPPSDTSKARDDMRESDAGASSAGGQGQGVPVDDADEAGALLKELTVGTVVDGKYRVDEVIGRGAMGVVVAATHLQLGERVALKFLRYRSRGANDDFRSRFKREARVSARLKNEHITRVIDVGVWRDHVPYMVMDYLTGTDLRHVIKTNGPQPIATAIDYIVQVCVGISEAHAAGIVHRDLKPSNLFVTRRPDGSDLVKILDFGISKWSADEAEIEELTQTGVVLGSPKYMAPEQLFGSSEVDTRADVWSIGAILYELLTGRPPFDLPTFTKICAELSTDHPPPRPSEKRPEVTPEIEAVVLKCFLRNPDQRTQTVAELAGDLLEAVQAPFAEPMRQKIASTLTAKGGRDALGVSGGSALSPLGASGSYGAVTGSTSGKMRIGGSTSPASSSGASHAIEASEYPPRRSRATAGIVVAGLLLAGGVAYFALAGRSPAPAPAASQPSASAAAAPVVATTLPPSASAGASASAAPSAAPSSAPSAVGSAVSSSAPVAAPAPPRSWRQGGWRPPPPRPAPPPATAAAAAAPPQTVATAAPTATQTAAAPTSKPDPLGDRQ